VRPGTRDIVRDSRSRLDLSLENDVDIRVTPYRDSRERERELVAFCATSRPQNRCDLLQELGLLSNRATDRVRRDDNRHERASLLVFVLAPLFNRR